MPLAKGVASQQIRTMSTHVARKHAVPVNLVHLPVFRREDDRNLRTAKCFTQVTNSLAWIATPVSRPRLTTLVEADATWT